jgi:hypothetical protein
MANISHFFVPIVHNPSPESKDLTVWPDLVSSYSADIRSAHKNQGMKGNHYRQHIISLTSTFPKQPEQRGVRSIHPNRNWSDTSLFFLRKNRCTFHGDSDASRYPVTHNQPDPRRVTSVTRAGSAGCGNGMELVDKSKCGKETIYSKFILNFSYVNIFAYRLISGI